MVASGRGGSNPEEVPKQTVQEQAPKKPQYIDIEKIDDRTPEGRRKLKDAMWSNLMLESQPVVDALFADLNSRGHYPTYDERVAMQTYVQNHNLFPHQGQSWEKALQLFPKYMSAEDQAVIALDRDDATTSAVMKKFLGTASHRVDFKTSSR